MIVRILIPTANNATISAPHHKVFEQFLLDAFGRFSRPPVLLSGSDDPVRYDDTTLVYAISIVNDDHKIALIDAVHFARAHYSQEKIFAEFPD